MKEEGAGTRRQGTPVWFRARLESWGAEVLEDSTAQVGQGKQGGQEIWAPGNTFVSPQRGGRCLLTGPQRRRSRGKVQGHWPRWSTGRTPSGLGSTETESPLPLLPPPPAAVAAASAKPSFRHPRRRLATCLPRSLLEPWRPPGNEYRQSQAQRKRHWRPP